MAEAAAVMMVAGAGMQIVGNFQANAAEAEAERANAAFYREQALLSMKAAEREERLFERESQQFFGSQVNAFAKGGVDMSGSALLKLAGTKQEMANESFNILETGKRNMNLALLRSSQAESNARRLRSVEYNLIQAAGPALSAAGGAMKAKGGSSGGSSSNTMEARNSYYSGPGNSMELINS